MDVHSIKQHIIDNPHYIENILDTAGFHKIRSTNRDEYRCAFDYDTNSTSVKVDKNTLASSDFGRGVSGDIITLVENKTGLGFRDTLKLICGAVGLDTASVAKKTPIALPFGGFFKDIGVNKDKYSELEVIDDSVLDQYALLPSKMFLDDGINAESQYKYKIGYDVMSQNVIVPWMDTRSRLVGIMGRHNSLKVDDGVPKWIPVVPFAKSKTLFAYDKNYKTIAETGVVFVGESEKFCMQLDSFEVRNGLAVGGSFISQNQVNNIQSLFPKLVITCFDEGLSRGEIIEQTKKIKTTNPFMNISVGYIYDGENMYLPKGSKASPSDMGKSVFYSLLKNCLHMV